MNGAELAFVSALVAITAGCLAYVILSPYISGENRARERRLAMSVVTNAVNRTATINRRDQVARSLKEIDAKASGTKVTLELKIARAGLDWTKQKFFVVSGLIGVAFTILVFLLTSSLLAALGALFAGILGLPQWLLVHLRKRRVAAFIAELPTAIDIITRGVRSGIPLGDCFRIISREAEEPIRSEFKQMVEAQTLGLPVGDVMQKMYERVPVADVNFFAIVISIQSSSGGNLSEALGNLSRVLRERKKMAGKIQAMSMEAKASGGIIAALPFIVGLLTYLSSPDYVSLLWTTDIGRIALVASAIWMSLGVFTMKKMISFDV